MNNAIVRLAIDLIHGKQSFSYNEKTFDASEATDVLRKALIEANEGNAKFNWKSYRRNKTQLFEIIEELVPMIVHDGLQGDEFFMNFVDERNLALGDTNEFVVEDDTTFIVTKIANGIATPDRQRIGHSRKVAVATSMHAVRAYEEFARFMAGRINWNELCDKVALSFKKAIWEDIYTAFKGINVNTIGLNANYVVGGSFNGAKMHTLIDHIEAATGKTATIVGTRAALARCEGAEKADSAKESMHNAGFYGKFDGTPMVMIRQQHKAGTEEFLFDNDTLYVVASDDKFLKLVYEGETVVDDRDFTANADMTLEFRMLMAWGVALVINGKIGKYTLE